MMKKIKLIIAKKLLNFLFILRKLAAKKRDFHKKQQKQKILLFFMSPGIGDAVMSTFFIKSLKEILPDCEIDILSSEGSKIIENDPFINHIEIISKNEQHNLKMLVKRLPQIRSKNYDAIIDIPWLWEGYSAERAAFLYAARAKDVYSANMPGFSFITNICWNYPDETVIDIYEKTLKLIAMKNCLSKNFNFRRSYQITIPEQEENHVLDYLSANAINGFVLINPKGSLAQRCISFEKTIKLALNLAKTGNTVILINCEKEIKTASSEGKGNIFAFEGNIWQISALAKHSSAIISVDTSTIHIAGAWDKPVLALYSENNGFGNKYVWKTHVPVSSRSIVLHSELAEKIPDSEIAAAAKDLLSRK